MGRVLEPTAAAAAAAAAASRPLTADAASPLEGVPSYKKWERESGVSNGAPGLRSAVSKHPGLDSVTPEISGTQFQNKSSKMKE